jgi:hypothetical protein
MEAGRKKQLTLIAFLGSFFLSIPKGRENRRDGESCDGGS